MIQKENGKTKSKETCEHKRYGTHGWDRYGNRRYRCKDCMQTWIDKRTYNQQSKSRAINAVNVFEFWLKGWSMKDCAQQFTMSKTQVSRVVNDVIDCAPLNSELFLAPELHTHFGIDAGYFCTTEGKKGLLLATCCKTGLIVESMVVDSENAKDIKMLIQLMKDRGFSVEACVTDSSAAFRTALKSFKDIRHFECRVHMFNSLRKHAPLKLDRRRYKTNSAQHFYDTKYRMAMVMTEQKQKSFALLDEIEHYINFEFADYVEEHHGEVPPMMQKRLNQLKAARALAERIRWNDPDLAAMRTNNRSESTVSQLKGIFRAKKVLGARGFEKTINAFIVWKNAHKATQVGTQTELNFCRELYSLNSEEYFDQLTRCYEEKNAQPIRKKKAVEAV